MRAFIAVLVIVCFVVAPLPSFAAKGDKSGPSDNAFEQADDNAKFKRDGQLNQVGDQDQDKDQDKDNEKEKKKKKKKKKQKGKGKNRAD